MKMKTILVPLVVVGALVGYMRQDSDPVAVPASYEMPSAEVATTTVRGQLVRVNPNGQQYPAAQLAVRVTHPDHGPSGFTYSQLDGLYYLVNVPVSRHQQDTYVIEVWLNQRDALRFPNIVARPQQFTDIAPIRVP